MKGKGEHIGRVSWALASFSFVLVGPASAFQLPGSGDFQGNLDTTVSYGVTFRAQDRDPQLVGISNGGVSGNINGDDGNLNYSKGDAAYNVVKMTNELDLRYRNFGAFARGSYFYDFANITRETLGDQARNRTGHYAELLDAYVRAEFPVMGQSLKLRLGQQVVNWGESTFIPNGLSVANAIDLSKLRVPGAEIKEALLPTPMAFASQSLGKTFSLEGFVLSRFDHVRTDPRGTFFSTDDLISDDGDKIFLGSGRRYDQHMPPADANLIPPPVSTSTTNLGQVWGIRSGDRDAKDSGQAGVALRIFAPLLNNTEFGLYHVNYHSRTPLISSVRGGVSVNNPNNALAPLPIDCSGKYIDIPGTFNDAGGPAFWGDDCTDKPASYFVEYPENIRIYGLSFNTVGPWGLAFQGESSYRPNQPVQYTVSELALAAGGLSNFLTGADVAGAGAAAAVPMGTEIKGYERLAVQQSQVSVTKVLGPLWKMDVLTVAGEAGYTHMDLTDGKYYQGYATSLAPGSNPGSGVSNAPIQGQATKDSWGYRVTARMDFLDSFFQTNISPRVTFSHDVSGVSATFNENVKALSYGLGTTFKQDWALDLSYTDFFGGRTFRSVSAPGTYPPDQPEETATSSNSVKDRDIVSMNLSYSF
ncbi:MAG: DUF1302 domain-containing protein [Elusimicrobia bacterium]|nr:DUF1302 domain-containing protein [Elusimicrobiota bacterium]